MKKTPYWNHNSAYYPWIRRNTADCRSVLDVGCGNGALIGFLDDGARELVGIDPDPAAVGRASENCASPHASFVCRSFEEFAEDRTYDAVVFAASLHHMEMTAAVRKAKRLLNGGGVLLVVGLADPSTASDYIVEALRVVPSKVLSAAHRMQTSEDIGVAVSYRFPTMDEVRAAAASELPGAVIRRGLHYRYLLKWGKDRAVR